MRRLLREPLVHFFVLGAALFVLYGWVSHRGFNAPNEIVVSRGQLISLQEQFKRTWQRPPTAEELQGLIDSWVKEEIFYREGLAMRLDRDDSVVRRRVGQKLEFMIDGATPPAPSEPELQAWLDAHADKYFVEPRYALRQIYFDPSRHGDRLQSDMAAAQRALESGKSIRGDSTLLPNMMDDTREFEVARTFGADFTASLKSLSLNSWHSVHSGFGVHLVNVAVREGGGKAALQDVRAAVERDLTHARAQEAREGFYEKLRANYAVRVESQADSG